MWLAAHQHRSIMHPMIGPDLALSRHGVTNSPHPRADADPVVAPRRHPAGLLRGHEETC